MKRIFSILFFLLFIFFPTPASAHSFGKLYSLPVPLWMYLFGAAATIAFSFLIIGYFFTKQNADYSVQSYLVPQNIFTKLLSHRISIFVFKFISLFLFILTILSGLFGSNVSTSNFNMTFFWIIFVLGLTYLTAVFGNIYCFLNPLRIVFDLVEKVFKTKVKGIIKYPGYFSYYPALVFYFLFIWVELFAKTTPFSLSVILLGYMLISILGGFLFGFKTWLLNGDFFNVFFRLIGKVSPLEIKDGRLGLRVPFTELLKGKANSFSLLLFIMFMLSSTAYDGFHSTELSGKIYYPVIHNLLQPAAGDNSYLVYETFSLMLSPFIFLGVYLFFLKIAKNITRVKDSITGLSLSFAFTLIPIALAYNLAHYYTLIITEGQNIIHLVSDPFGLRWNLFGTAFIKPNLTVINTSVTWNFQVAFILIGHIIGVYLAHQVALKIFADSKKALVSQIPLLILMIVYTLTGLLILSLPLSVPG